MADTNNLLKSIGAGIDLNISDVVEKQIKEMLTRYRAEIRKASDEAKKSGQDMANGLKTADTQIKSLLSTTQKLNADGSLTETRKGYDELGRSITEVYKAGQLLNRSVSTDSALAADIKNANELYKEQLANIKKIYELKTRRLGVGDGTAVAADIDRQIAETQQLMNANQQLIGMLDQEAVARSKLVGLTQEEAAAQQRYNSALAAQQDKTNANALKNGAGTAELKQLQEAYRQLTNAYRQYNLAVKSGNEVGQAYWSQRGEQLMQEINGIEEKIGSLNIEESVRTRILDLINQARNAEAMHNQNVSGLNNTTSALGQTLDRISSRLLQMAATMLVLRGLTSIWRNATGFAQQYYDKLNEIRIVTGKSQQQANQLGTSYRNLAKNMKVSTTEVAVAATEFWRQGLDEQQVNERLVATTQYAKISAMEFEDAAEVITAATNTMGISAQHVVDIFAYLGDNSASGPDEVGKAMQKASASAKEFGLTFEWLGAYIATISEATRQAPEVIGTSINSIMARLHSIKEKGFNEEDETRINDIAKALGTIDVALMDNEGNWRDMSDIFSDIASKWDTLSGKQKSYISTTMAGTRQQNYFIALMSDMARGVEGGSRAYELYAGAMSAAGTAAQKYSVWQESVTAAQNRLTTATQEFYSLLNAEWMKGFYENMAGVVEIITAGTDAMNGWNLIIPVATAGIIGLIAVVYKAVTAIKAMQAALAAGSGIASAVSGGTVGAIIAAVGLLAAVATMIVGSVSKNAEVEKIDYSGTIQSITSYRDNVAT